MLFYTFLSVVKSSKFLKGFSMSTSRFIICVLIPFNFVLAAPPIINKEDDLLRKDALNFFSAVELSELNKTKSLLAELGQQLYFDASLSANGTISCNSCHNVKTFGVDNEATSPGHDKTRGGRNSPTTFNAKYNFVQFWDGRAKDLAEQATGPLLNPIEHGIKDEAALIEIIKKSKYVDLFSKSFAKEKNPITLVNVGKAIAAFEEHLVTDSSFDDFLRGNLNAISSRAKKGLKKFIEVGCVSCHMGVNLGSTTYQKIGLVNEYKTTDLGRYAITKDENDKFHFKVPTLKNIEKTAPYFHDGSVKTLSEAIKLMGHHQLGVTLNKTEIADIENFLKSLTAKSAPKL